MGCASRAALGLAGVAVCAGGAWAQRGIWPEPVLPGLRRVDAGVADVGPLGTSQRQMPVDLRVPTGFEGVYAFERPGPLGKPETMYMRANGSLAAVFPRSVYVASPGGLVPAIPAGTVFIIGSPLADPRAFGAKRGRPVSPLAVDQRVPREDETPRPPPAARSARASESLSIWNSERVRRQRVGELLGSLVDPAEGR